MNKFLPLTLAVASCLAACPCWVNADWKDEIGYTALKARIGDSLENGAGVVVAMSEAQPLDENKVALPWYLPNVGDSEFDEKTIVDASGFNENSTGHATAVARYFFGRTTSIAGGIREIHGFAASDWAFNESGAATGTDPTPPVYQIINNSWVARASSISEANAAIVLSHVDHLVDRYDTLVVSATDNGGALPRLMAPSYNSITVGSSDGGHAAGSTQAFYGPGRPKPDIVAPNGATSYATPMVSSAAALLYEKGMGTDAVRSETMRAVLLAGATKTGLAGWDRTTTRPLDEVYGAGQLNVDNSYSILEGGQFIGSASEPIASVGEDGWDYQPTFDSEGALYYDIEVATGMQMDDLSIILAWNREVIDLDGSTNFDPSFKLANFNLRLYDSTDSFLGSLVDASLSDVDNVEHIFVDKLSTGRYTVEITGNQARDFAIAWSSSFSAVPEPSSGFLLMVAGLAISGCRRRRSFRKSP